MGKEEKLTEEENRIFHLNYDYMWKKLSTTYYHVKNQTLEAADIKGKEELPSYTNLSKCRNPQWKPSKKFVDKIVKFYNCNLLPEIDTYQFLTKDLSKTDTSRYRNRSAADERFLGNYYGYYYSAATKDKMNGAMLKIYQRDKILQTRMITGIQNEKEMRSIRLKQLFEKDTIEKEMFDEYFQNLEIENRRSYYYEGIAEVTGDAMMISFWGLDEEHRKLFLTLNIDCFTPRVKRTYLGGLAFVMTTGDGPFDAQFFHMCLERVKNAPFSLKDERVKNILEIQIEDNHHAVLTSKKDREWFELLLNKRKDEKTRRER